MYGKLSNNRTGEYRQLLRINEKGIPKKILNMKVKERPQEGERDQDGNRLGRQNMGRN